MFFSLISCFLFITQKPKSCVFEDDEELLRERGDSQARFHCHANSSNTTFFPFSLSFPLLPKGSSVLVTPLYGPLAIHSARCPIPICSLLPCRSNTLHTHAFPFSLLPPMSLPLFHSLHGSPLQMNSHTYFSLMGTSLSSSSLLFLLYKLSFPAHPSCF